MPLLDEHGRPLPVQVDATLRRLVPRLQRTFPACLDEDLLRDVLEEAGQKIALREQWGGPIDRLPAYAWVTLRSVATSTVRLGSTRVLQGTIAGAAGARALAVAQAVRGGPETIERRLLLRELLARLSRIERQVLLAKYAGYTSQEIADWRGGTTLAVDTLWSRAVQRLRQILGVAPASVEDDQADDVAGRRIRVRAGGRRGGRLQTSRPDRRGTRRASARTHRTGRVQTRPTGR